MPVGLLRALSAVVAIVLLALAWAFGWWLRGQQPVAAGQRAAGPGLTATEVVTFQPWSGNGVAMANKTWGSCFGPSGATQRGDAFRCSRDNEIFDPCFASPDRSKVACPRSSITDVTVMELTEPLKQPVTDREGQPWLLNLEDGQDCGAITGAGPLAHVSGMEPNGYGCTLGFGYGSVNSNGPVWTIQMASDEKGKLVTERIAKAYK